MSSTIQRRKNQLARVSTYCNQEGVACNEYTCIYCSGYEIECLESGPFRESCLEGTVETRSKERFLSMFSIYKPVTNKPASVVLVAFKGIGGFSFIVHSIFCMNSTYVQ